MSFSQLTTVGLLTASCFVYESALKSLWQNNQPDYTVIEAGPFSFTEDAAKIGTNQYSYTNEDLVLETRGVHVCIAVTIYSKDTCEGALAHFLPTTGLRNSWPILNEQLKEIRAKFTGKDFVIRMYSPQASDEFRVQLAAAIELNFGVRVDLGSRDTTLGYAVTLDNSTGGVGIEKFDLGAPYDNRPGTI